MDRFSSRLAASVIGDRYQEAQQLAVRRSVSRPAKVTHAIGLALVAAAAVVGVAMATPV